MGDTEFMTHIIAEICNYAVMNGMEPDDTLQERLSSHKVRRAE